MKRTVIIIVILPMIVTSCLWKNKKNTDTQSNLNDNYEQYSSEMDVSQQEVIRSNNRLLQQSKYELPYDNKIDPEAATYEILDSGIAGINEYSCGDPYLRYIPLPDKNNISVVLVPMDCGDFAYRYYLLTIKEHRIVSAIYVEGEWWEPGSDEIEKTNFSIDENYLITVRTVCRGEEKMNHYSINDEGQINEQYL